MKICLFGAAGTAVPEVYITKAEEFGTLLAEHGHSLVFGAGATGMMGAAARGVHRGGGQIIGIAPRFFDRPGVLTPLCSEMVFTTTMDERKVQMESRSDAFVIVPGGIGTLDEFFEVLTLCSLGQMKKPVALYNIDGYFRLMIEFLRKMEVEHFIEPELWDCFGIYDEPEALLRYLENRI